MDQVLALIQGENKPFGLQNLVDRLACVGLKKAQIQKALDQLAEQGKVVVKEFGKTKIFIPPQELKADFSKEELDAKNSQLKELQVESARKNAEVKALEGELTKWKSSLTEAEMKVETQKLHAQLIELKEKLTLLTGGTVLVSPEQRAAAAKKLLTALDVWRKRKGIFRNLWGAISEGIDGKESELLEDMGVETDEVMNCNLRDLESLIPSTKLGAGGFKRQRI